MKTGRIQTQGDPNQALAALLKSLVDHSIVNQIMVSAVQPSGGVSLALFGDSESMEGLLPWAPVMPVQGARMVSRMAFDNAGDTVGVVCRPCEARAVVELIKLNQIRPEGLTFITIDCPGTCEYKAFTDAGLDAAEASAKMVAQMQSGAATPPESAPLRLACSVCENPAAAWGDLRVKAYGVNTGEALVIEAADALAEALEKAEAVTFGEGDGGAGKGIVDGLIKDRAAKRDALFAQFTADNAGLDGMKKAFSTCIRCLNCMENCPICYCKQCIFKSPTFDHPAGAYTRWATRKGVQKLPSETVLFHLTRLNHMASSCIGCGLCDTACPMGLPVATLFRKTAQKVQKMLDYVPGRSLEDDIPLMVFREDELQDETGAKD